MPSPVGEGGSQRLTDEAFFPSVEVLQKATRYSSSTAKRSPFSSRRRQGCEDGRSAGKRSALLIQREAVPLSRCGSGTLGLFHSTGVKFSPLVPLRYRQEKARVR